MVHVLIMNKLQNLTVIIMIAYSIISYITYSDYTAAVHNS